MNDTVQRLGTIQRWPAMPEWLYSSISARCVCGCTIRLRNDGQWTHSHGFYCRESAR